MSPTPEQGTGRVVPIIATAFIWSVLLLLFPLTPALGSAATVLALLLTLLAVPLAVLRGTWRPLRHQPAMLAFGGAFIALGICFVATADAPNDPIYILNFLSLPLAVVFYLVLRQYPPRFDAQPTLVWLCLAACAVAALVAVNDVVFRGEELVSGFNMGPHVVARIALVFAFAALTLVLSSTSRWRFLAYAGVPLALVVLYLSGTRGALVAIAPMVLVYAAFLYARREDRLQVWFLAAFSAVMLVVLLFASDRLGAVLQMVVEMVSGGGSGSDSAGERLARVAAAWQLFWQSPLIGHGWASFAELAYPILGDRVEGGPTDRYFQFHNDLANFAVSAGIVGVLCWVAILAAPIIGALATPRDGLFRARLYLCIQLSVAYFVFGLTDLTLGYDLQTTLYAFLTAFTLVALRDPPAATPTP